MAKFAPAYGVLLCLVPTLGQDVSGLGAMPLKPLTEKSAEPAKVQALLGVHLVPIPPMVQHQAPDLGGGGLLIDELLPNSPAVAAGLKRYDLLAKADGQTMFSPEQFAGYLRNKLPGDSMRLEVVRGGRSLEIEAKLGSCPVTKDSPGLEVKMAAAKQERAMLLLEFLHKNPTVSEAYPELLTNLLADAGLSGAPLRVSTEKVVESSDGEGKIVLRTSKGKTAVSIENTEGQVIYEGTFDAGTEGSGVPEMFRARLAKLAKQMEDVPIPTSAP